MGSYTELKFNAKLKKSTPKIVINILKRVIIDRGQWDYVFNERITHPFFKCPRWGLLFISNNFDEEIKGGEFFIENERWSLSIHTEFKNYDGEIEKFIDWISPFIEGRKKKQYLGSYKGENYVSKINIYLER